MLELTALILAGVHFSAPLAYYVYMKRYLDRPWDLKIDENYRPYITIILPTYNEAKIIRDRLDNLYKQDYPKKSFEVVIVDSSDDDTSNLIEEWAKQHNDLTLKLIRENTRKGKAYALNYASGEVIVIADADAL